MQWIKASLLGYKYRRNCRLWFLKEACSEKIALGQWSKMYRGVSRRLPLSGYQQWKLPYGDQYCFFVVILILVNESLSIAHPTSFRSCSSTSWTTDLEKMLRTGVSHYQWFQLLTSLSQPGFLHRMLGRFLKLWLIDLQIWWYLHRFGSTTTWQSQQH